MKFLAKTLLAVALAGVAVPRRANGAEVMVDDCSDLERAVEATLTEDTIANITTSLSFFSGEDCGNGTFKTFEVKTNQLTILALEANYAQFSDIRFVVTDGGKLVFTHDSVRVSFDSDDENVLEVDGGFLHVDQDSTARFLGDLTVLNYKVSSVTEEGSDFAKDEWEGGCVWNNGYFRVDGYTEFHSCDNHGGGESPPGRGGAIFNAANGSILFEGGVLIEDTAITDNEGNSGAGIYNMGKVNIKGDSIFQQLYADTQEAAGGGIFNAEGAKVTFRNNAAVVFIENAAANGGAIFNQGEFRFTGPAFFTRSRGTAIVNSSPGTMKLSEGSSFWFNDEGEASVGVGAVTNRDGATLDIPDDTTFVSNTGSTCEDIYLEGPGTDDDDFTCFS